MSRPSRIRITLSADSPPQETRPSQAAKKSCSKGDDQTKLGGTVPAGHQGGALHFGKDGKLYIAIGDQTAGKPAQGMNSLLGRLLRINPDGSIP